MKQSMLSSTVLVLLLSALGAQATKSKQTQTCAGNNDVCNFAPQSNQQSPQVSASVPITPVPARKRSVTELFGQDGSRLFRRIAAGSAPAKSAGPGGASQGAAGSQGGSGRPPLYAEDISSMIKNGEALPKPLQGPVSAMAQKSGLKMPDPSTLKPTPAQHAGHPCTEALQHLQNGEIHPDVEKAARAAWGGGAAGGAAGGKSGGKSAGPTGGATGGKGSTMGAGKVQARAPHYVQNWGSGLESRNALAWDEELYARDADANADYAMYEYLLQRSAEPIFYEDDIYTREAALFDDDFDLYARDAEADYGYDFEYGF